MPPSPPANPPSPDAYVALRCAVYARTSSNEEAEHEFGSIQAQLEAGQAYIASQRGLHWSAVTHAYDDPDVSGATLKRPGLTGLLADIESGHIDVVVVQKIDRLTRSMADFARLMEFVDRYGVTLVSVTQHLNSRDPLGRLAIHTLMSFAQFEREIISERVRDKIAATRRKGLWVGSVPPLGYVLNGQRLVIEESEAQVVREMFQRFVELGSTSDLVKELNARGVTTKAWLTKTGKARGGRPLDKNYLYKLLNNRLFVGELNFDGGWHPGKHVAIIARELWDQVHALMSTRTRRARTRSTTVMSQYLLKGLVFSKDGRAFSPWCSSSRKGRHYSYYIAQKDIAVGAGASGLPRFAAHKLERLVIEDLRAHWRDPTRLIEMLPEELKLDPRYRESDVVDALAQLDAIWHLLFPGFQHLIVREFVSRVIVEPEDLVVQIDTHAVIKRVHAFLKEQAAPTLMAPKSKKRKGAFSVLKK